MLDCENFIYIRCHSWIWLSSLCYNHCQPMSGFLPILGRNFFIKVTDHNLNQSICAVNPNLGKFAIELANEILNCCNLLYKEVMPKLWNWSTSFRFLLSDTLKDSCKKVVWLFTTLIKMLPIMAASMFWGRSLQKVLSRYCCIPQEQCSLICGLNRYDHPFLVSSILL